MSENKGERCIGAHSCRTFTALFVLVFSWLPLHTMAQFYQFQNLNVKDGLPSSEVYEMIQDSRGFMWFVTDMGVSWYDGYSFTNFTTEDGLTDNTIFGAYEDHHHHIWFRSSLGKLSYFSYEDHRIHPIATNDVLTKTLQNAITTSMYMDEHDTIWLGTSLHFLVRIGPGPERQVDTIQLKNDGAYLYETHTGGILYGGASYNKLLLNVYVQGKEAYTIETGMENFFGPGRCVVKRLGSDYLASVNNVLFVFNRKGIISLKKCDDSIITLLTDSSHVYAGTFHGMRTFHKDLQSSTNWFEKFDRKVITKIFLDTEDELWMCTKGHGIYYIPHRNFRYYTPEDGLTPSSISRMNRFRDYVITGHLSGEIGVLQGKSVRMVMPERVKETYTDWNEVTDILNIEDRRLYVETGLTGYTFSPERNVLNISPECGIKRMIRSRDGHLISIKYRTMIEMDSLGRNERLLVPYIPYYADNLFEDKEGTIWVCTINGVYTYSKDEGFQYEGDHHEHELSARVVEFAEGRHNVMWMASRGEGVMVRQNNRYHHIRREDGLSSNMCRTLYIDSNQTVWVGTNSGLNKITVTGYSPFQYTIDTYYASNGLLTNEVNVIVPHQNRLWLAHNNGITVFDPADVKNNKTPPPIYINQMQVNGEVPDTTVALNQLRHDQNDITIRYIGLSYKNPGQVEYKYMLEGLDTNWTYGTNTSVKYQTLPQGTYRFVVYAINRDGFLSNAPATVEFTIRPVWWNTWTFRFLAIGITAILIGISFRYRLTVLKRRERLRMIRRMRISQAELKALRAQMNPHFIFNSINSVQYFITKNDPKSSQKYLAKFARLIRYVVDNSKPSLIPLSKEIEALKLYLDLESLRFEDRFEYQINIDRDVDVDHSDIPSMLIQPYVENAIWHGLMHKQEKGILTVTISTERHGLLCVIEDNGIGRQKSAMINARAGEKKHKSLGMSITRERLDIMNERRKGVLSIHVVDLTDPAGLPAGTRVEIHIPLS